MEKYDYEPFLTFSFDLMKEEDYKSEIEKEAEWNKLFEKVISYSPFGQWYGYMKKASNLLTKNLPQRIAVDNKDGKPYVQYKGDLAKIAGVWGSATHTTIAKDLSEKKWMNALGDLLGGGHIKDMVKQSKKKGVTVYDISPQDVERLWKKKLVASSPVNAKLIEEAEKKDAIAKKNKISKTEKPKKVGFIKGILQKLFGNYKQ